MPRNHKLTWQLGTGGRSGRWRKKYRGNVYYFPGGRGKTDREAYEAALAAWEKQKVEIDVAVPKPHELDYKNAIHEWELVLTWSRKHDDEAMADKAIEKLSRLKKRLEMKKPPPVWTIDTFAGQFDRNERYPEISKFIASTANTVLEFSDSLTDMQDQPGYEEYRAATETFLSQAAESFPRLSAQQVIDPSGLDVEMADPLKTEEAVWRDRLEVMQRATPSDKALKTLVERFINNKKAAAAAGELSTARVYALQLHLNDFAEWFGHGSPVDEITGRILSDYRLHLLKKVESMQWSRNTANDRLVTVRSFVRWLWQIEAIPQLPRIMDGRTKALNIGTSSSEIKVFTKQEITKLLNESSDRTKLYILLMLNCGMTQKDIADLQHSEFDWDAGRIIRKRSKTRKHGTVPEVNYKLWPETVRLLKQERSRGRKGTVLLNANGQPLLAEEVTASGKYKKNDNIKSAFYRLQKKTKIKKPLKSLKKTSATLIRGPGVTASSQNLMPHPEMAVFQRVCKKMRIRRSFMAFFIRESTVNSRAPRRL